MQDITVEMILETVRKELNELEEKYRQSKSPKKEWEIVAYKFRPLSEEKPVLVTPNSQYWKFAQSGDSEYIIHSVRRLSDGEVFSVGDRTNNGFIRGFKIGVSENGVLDNNQIYVTCVATVGDEFPCAGLSLRFIKKVVAPLFTTLDGVALQENEWCWVVDKHYNLLPESEKINEFKKNYYSNCFIFSTREAAEKYILENKPLLSLNDVREACENLRSNSLEIVKKNATALVKQKLNQ